MSLRLDGPDFLCSVADAERANGNDINAATYDQRANEWRDDLRELEQMRKRAESAEYRLAQIQAQAMAA